MTAPDIPKYRWYGSLESKLEPIVTVPVPKILEPKPVVLVSVLKNEEPV